jgi:hypothetical protein
MLPSDNSLYLINADSMHKVAVDTGIIRFQKWLSRTRIFFVQIPE